MRVGLNILLKSLEQAKNTENIITTILDKEVHYQKKVIGIKISLLFFSNKEKNYKHLYF